MFTTWRLGAATLFCIFFAMGSTQAAAQSALGTWLTDGGKSQVRISTCGRGLCGKIVWLKAPNDETGNPKTDSKNADKSLRGRPLMGLSLLSGMTPDRDTRWTGEIYNPEDGKTYKAYMTLTGPQTLLVEGCILGGFICRKQNWVRSQ